MVFLSHDTDASTPNIRKTPSKPWINKHAVQGLIYRFLQNTEFADLHDRFVSKNFCFSDWLKTRKSGVYRLIISSPNEKFIRVLEKIARRESGRLQFKGYVLIRTKTLKLTPNVPLRTGSPIVLVREKNPQPIYYSFRDRTITLNEFDEIIKRGAVARYRATMGESDFVIEEPLFSELQLEREIAVPVKMRGRSFPIIGSKWKTLVLNQNRSFRKFMEWLIDAGMGQKTSLGFGFLQPKRKISYSKLTPLPVQAKSPVSSSLSR